MRAKSHGPCRCRVEADPLEVDAGAELTVTIRTACPHGCDLRRQRVSIRASDDAELASGELAEHDGEDYVSRVVLRAPLKVGEHACRAVLAAHESLGIPHEESVIAFSFVTRAHAMSVHAWDLPSAIATGDRFRFKVGVKCSAGCALAGRPLSAFDHTGGQVGAGRLAEVWPGTSALHFAELEAQTPPATGDYPWRIDIPALDAGVPHAAGSCAFIVKVVGPPDHEVTVAAFDRESGTPIAGAHVLLHPYRAFTDANGVAKLKVVKGSYRLCISGFNYIGYEDRIDVECDVAVRAELAAEPEGQEDYAY